MVRILMFLCLVVVMSIPLDVHGKTHRRKHGKVHRSAEFGRLTPAEKQLIKDVQAKTRAKEHTVKPTRSISKKSRHIHRKGKLGASHGRHRVKHTRHRAK